MKTETARTINDVVRSARLWHIWMRLGMQDVRLKFRRSAVGVGWIFVNLAVLVVVDRVHLRQPARTGPARVHPVSDDRMITLGLPDQLDRRRRQRLRELRGLHQADQPADLRLRLSVLRQHQPDDADHACCAFVIVAVIYRVPLGAGTLLAFRAC